MRTIYLLDGSTKLPKTLSKKLNKTYPFQGGGGLLFESGESATYSGLRFLKFFDENNVEIHRLQYGFDTSSTVGNRTINIDSAPVTQVAQTATYDANGGLTIGTTSFTSTLVGNIKLWNDASTANNFTYSTQTLDLVAPQTSTVTEGLAVDVGAGYIRYYDAASGDDVLVICTYQPPGAISTDNLGYTHESAVQGLSLAPNRNSEFATVALGDTLTATTARSASVFQLNFTNAGGTMGGNTYWVNSSYDSPTLKTGTDANGSWAEFYRDGELVAMMQCGNDPGGAQTVTPSFPKSFPDVNYTITNTGQFGGRFTTNTYIRTVSNFTAQNRNRNLASTHAHEWVAWWIKI